MIPDTGDINSEENNCEWLKQFITEIPNFPSPGIKFKNIVPLLANKEAFQFAVQKLSELAWKMNAEAIVGIESRGFIFGAPVALSLGVPFIPIRKGGKLPGKTVRVEYNLEYGTGELELPASIINEDTRVVIIDDVLATGGTARAAKALLDLVGAQTVGFLSLVELSYLKGREHLTEIPSKSLLTF